MQEREKESESINETINEIKTIKTKGGKRPGAGRKLGVPNILSRDIKALAGQYGPEALKKLKDLMRHSANEQVQLGAAKEIMDRSYGRPSQAIDVNDKRVIVHIHRERAKASPVDIARQGSVDITSHVGLPSTGSAERADLGQAILNLPLGTNSD